MGFTSVITFVFAQLYDLRWS